MKKKESLTGRLHESLGERHKGKKKQSLTERSHESEGMERSMGKGSFGGLKSLGKKIAKKVIDKKSK
jgi:hypothetical protein